MPTALLATEAFANLASVAMKGRGMAAAPLIVLPPTEIVEYGARAEVEKIGEKALDQVVNALTARI